MTVVSHKGLREQQVKRGEFEAEVPQTKSPSHSAYVGVVEHRRPAVDVC